jgi:hypothetical protein
VGARRAGPGRPPSLQRGERSWRRYLGPPNSWRRVVLTGVGGGVALALVAALIASVVGGGGFGSLDKKQPTAVAPAAGSSDVADDVQPPEEAPVEEPTVEEPTVEAPTEEPTVEEPAADTPTEEILPTDTPVVEPPVETPPAGETQ